ncbi:MAG: AbrB/MazE/SpoVT family DNA-binding domain-containing protein [Bdellovibrio sp.]|uniref:AbrB/MazE/SpoVT family DNA-binding domain-containing protein n=1 Tax=Bdellovibrio sp. TaxID=28201 RepID=UPI0039E24B65|nr:AbrB/MazE/SpoVT family DNA-binding domain-containing protein [Bdellovibrio sp.]
MGNSGATSKASKKNQTTIPARVRKALGVAKGDTLLWTISGGEVSVRILKRGSADWKKTSELSLLEWSSEEDQEASP